MIQKVSKGKKEHFFKEQEDRTLNTILYCSRAGWAETFYETSKLEEHMLSGKRSIPEEISSIDQVLYWENEAKITTPPLKLKY